MTIKFLDEMRYEHSSIYKSLRAAKKLTSRDKLAELGKKALFFVGVSAGLFGMVFGFDLLADFVEDCFTALLELVEEGLETLYRKQFKMDQYHAQMATAYTGFAMIMGAGYFIFRRLSAFFKDASLRWHEGYGKAKEVWIGQRLNAQKLWVSMDGFNKCFAVIGLVVLAIPVLAAICLILGKVFAELV